MQVTVTNLDMTQTVYGFAPDNWAKIVEYYSELVQSGEIYTYSAKM